MKSLFKSSLRRIGLDIVKYPPPKAIELHLRSFLQQHQVDLVLDVGAFTGIFCKVLRDQVGYKGKIVSFEPVKSSFTKLSDAMSEDPNWTGHNFGLSDTESEAVINIYDSGDFNSLHAMKGKDASAYGVSQERQETIQLRSLDAIWHQIIPLNTGKILLKMDTQGHDIKVLQGAAQSLRDVAGILSELPAIEIYEGMTSMSNMIEAFKAFRFTPVGFYPVNQPESYKGVVPEFDALFLRQQ